MKKSISLFLCLTIILSVSANICNAKRNSEPAVEAVGEYLYETICEPQVSSVGGEWAVLGLARSGMNIPKEYYEKYYRTVEKYVEEREGILHSKKYTEYSRVAMAITAIGKDPNNVSGYNLLLPLGDFEKTVFQGINGPIWALIALNSGHYEIPENDNADIQATKEMYVNYILEKQLPNGAWALSSEISDTDITAMALQALAEYKDSSDVALAIERALGYISLIQNENGGFSNGNEENSESAAQVIVALTELGISPNDSRFVKNGNTILDNLKTFYLPGAGFKHLTTDTVSNQMATEQCFYALVAVERFNNNLSSLYSMEDVAGNREETITAGLLNKNPDVQKKDVVFFGKTFNDIKGHKNQGAIEELAARNIINGKTENNFEPNSTMTRAEYAAIITKALGISNKGHIIFDDVLPTDWYYDYISAAYSYGIITGVSETEFNPGGNITREEAAVMTSRAAKLCGMDFNPGALNSRDILAEFPDYIKISAWATDALAFCYDEGILSKEVYEINPKEYVTRAEIADMLYNMLYLSELL